MLPPRSRKVGELASSRVNPAGTDAVAVADALGDEDRDEVVGDADAVVVAEVVGSKDTVGIGVGSGSDVQPARDSATTDVAQTARVRPAMTVRDERMVTSWPRRYRRGGRAPRRLARDRVLPENQRRTLDELSEDLDLRSGDTRAKQSAFWTMLVLSAVIATAGVLADSTATVIGAMIIAPLSTPIMG